MSTTTYRPLTCEHCGTTENISWAAEVARILCPDCYQQGAAAMSSHTIERRARGWYVVGVRCPDGIARDVGPFPTASRAATWALLHIG